MSVITEQQLKTLTEPITENEAKFLDSAVAVLTFYTFLVLAFRQKRPSVPRDDMEISK